MSRSTVAVVGASPRNFWTNCAIHNLRTLDPSIEVVPVTPNHEEVAGLAAVPGVDALPVAPRAAIIAIRREASVDAVRTLVAAGTPDIVLVTDGFGERGDDVGRRLQAELTEIVSGSGTRLWGPNCVGFADFSERICAVGEPVWLDAQAGPVSIVSQSGALLSAFVAAAAQERLGVDFCASTGNGAVLGVPEALDLVLRRPTTRVACVYLEGLSSAQLPRFLDAVAYAREAGKRVVVLKSGVSERGRRAVLSHTASIAGTDEVFSELLREHGVLRADGIDEMMRLATLCLAGVKPGRPRAVSVLGGSGGAAALTSDLADRHGVNLTVFADATVARIRELAGPGSFIDNPLDVIGVKRREGDESVNATVFRDPNTGVVVLPWSVQFPSDSPEQAVHTWNWNDLARLSTENEMPLVITAMAPVPETDFVRGYRDRHPHVAVVHNLRLTMSALGKLCPADADPAAEAPQAAPPGAEHTADAPAAAEPAEERVLSEADSRELVAGAGVPVVPAVRVPRGADAAAVAGELRGPFAVKVIAPIGHKSRIGGVALGVARQDELPAVIKRIEENVTAAGLAADAIEGCLVEEMVFGREILVGLNTDPVLGRYAVVGLGGTATELARRTVTRRLPLRDGQAEEMLAAMGVTGHPAAAEAVAGLCAAFAAGPLARYETIEVNPLIVTPDACWAADAVVTRFGDR